MTKTPSDTKPTPRNDRLAELLRMPPTVLVPRAGKFGWGFSRGVSYALNAAGDFPCEVQQIGGRFYVRTADLARALGVDPATLLVDDRSEPR